MYVLPATIVDQYSLKVASHFLLTFTLYISYKGNSGFAPASRTVCFGFDLLRLAAKTKMKVIILSHQPYCRLLIIEDPDQFYVQIEIHDSANEYAAMYALTIMIWTIIHCWQRWQCKWETSIWWARDADWNQYSYNCMKIVVSLHKIWPKQFKCFISYVDIFYNNQSDILCL